MCNTQRQQGVAAAAEAVAAAYGLNMAPSVLPDHCCWFGVSCCTPSTCYGVPPSACNCTYGMVTALYLSHNNLTSGNTAQSLEPSIQALSCSLTSLELHKNQLEGTIPTAVTALHLLSNLNLAFNNLTGTIPATLGNMASLQSLALTSNRITGTLPSELCKLGPNSPLNNLYLSRNLLTGTLNISTCGNLYFIDGATNYFSGEPVGLEEYNHLQVANFSENNFTGILFGIHLVQVDFSLNPK
ncbi:hypothetical protein CEUSTIGMA_g6727.t1 [Chlamydomonas eustigma]|uniref:Leucine-rich repeat-containing N-terminal plant-type domain-containing protein n=1 Tax=Chlamydomonas eustigma TaxID=1157962 RepID=A0A250X899_9CHLO|nr:hypothetical protein CEUSTIGMA_g6727.t1 [Chlamydomonas eustigma]|eukprot:GAX79286.1 hypothetical protein CEUSTIGMA_g6727.t1 [Chlamydomonas eustigma]